MRIQLSDHFNYKTLFRFALPSIIMMVFTSIYSVVDGFFVSNFVGNTPFAAINLIMPILMITGAFGFMMGTGGTAIVAKSLGERKHAEANEYFSLIVYVTVAAGAVIAVIGYVLMPFLSEHMLKAEGALLEYCISYGRIIIAVLPFFMLQNLFQSFFVAAEKPKLGLLVTVISGVTNIVLDALLVAVFSLGLEGAAIATAISQVIGGTVPIIYFARKNGSLLRLTKTRFYGGVLLKSVTNGSSELMSNISSSIVTVLYNRQLMKFAGQDGVSAYGAIMYVSYIFIAMFIGYSIGSAPVVGYHYGAGNRDELKSLLKKSTVITFSAGAVMFALAFIFAEPLSAIFIRSNPELLTMTVHGMRIFSLSFIFCGFSIFSSSFFTALNNGPVSAAISFLRTLIYQLLGVLLLPLVFKLDGIWYSMIVAELFAFATTLVFLLANRKKYGYM